MYLGFLNLILVLIISDKIVLGRISNERKCADADCSVPVSLATTLLTYHADDERLLSFKRNVKATVYSKEAGDKPTFWEIEINGKRGYAPKNLLRETKVLVKPKEVTRIVSTGRDDVKHNVTQANLEKIQPIPTNSIETPPLPVANSKGLFGMMGGVSADSVPPNSPDINPQTTEKYEVFEGTTIYNDNVPEKPSEIVPETTSPSILSESSVENNAFIDDKSEKETSLDSGSSDNGQVADVGKTEEDVEEIQAKPPSEVVENVPTEINAEPTGMFDSFMSTVSSFVSSGSGENEGVGAPVEEYESSGEEDGSKEKEGVILLKKEQLAEITEQTDSVSETLEDIKSKVVTGSPESVNSVPKLFTTVKSSVEIPDGAKEKPLKETSNQELPDSGVSDKEDEKFLENSQLEEINEKADYQTHIEMETGFSNISSVKTESLNGEITSSSKQTASEVLTHVKENVEPFVKAKVDEQTVKEATKSKPIKDNLHLQSTEAENPFEKIEQMVKEESQTGKVKTNVEQIVTNASYDSDLLIESENTDSDSLEVTTTNEPAIKPVHEEPEDTLDSDAQIVDQNFRQNEIEKDVLSESEEVVVDIENNTKSSQEKLSSKQSHQDVFESSLKTEHIGLTLPNEQAEKESAPQEDLKKDEPEPNQVLPSPPPFFHAVPSMYKPTESSKYSSEVDNTLDISLQEESKEAFGENSKSKYSQSSVYDVLESDKTSETEKDLPTVETTEVPVADFASQEETFQFEDTFTEASVVEVDPTESFELPKESTDKEISQESSEEESSWLSPILNLFSSSGSESVPSTVGEVPSVTEKADIFHTSEMKEGSCLAGAVGEAACEELGKGAPPDHSGYTSLYSTDMLAALDLLEKIPLETTIWLVITAVVVLIFSLGHYYIEAHRRDGPLVAVINKLEREVLILKKESSILEDRLCTAQEQLEAWNTNSSENDALIIELKQELEEIKGAKADLEEQVTVLKEEVESVTESCLEMDRLFNESLASVDGSQVLLSTVENLREKLELQESEIAKLSQIIRQKDVEMEELNEKLVSSAEVATSLEDKIISLTREKEEEALQMKDKHRRLIDQLEEVMETKALEETRVSTEMSRLRLSIEELQKNLAEKDLELEEVKEVVKELRSTDSNEKMDALFDVVGVRAQLKLAATERDNFREKFQEEEGARKLLEGHMNKITQEVADLKNSFETAEKEKIEALTKLQVLSNYFKEKESQLQKELGMQESMWLQKQSDDHTIYEQMRSLREENEKFKLQNESLKKEIVEQESSFKIQLANVEQKAHENWVTSRQAERRVKEVQQEAAQLRNRLTMEKTANFSLDDSKPNIIKTNFSKVRLFWSTMESAGE